MIPNVETTAMIVPAISFARIFNATSYEFRQSYVARISSARYQVKRPRSAAADPASAVSVSLGGAVAGSPRGGTSLMSYLVTLDMTQGCPPSAPPRPGLHAGGVPERSEGESPGRSDVREGRRYAVTLASESLRRHSGGVPIVAMRLSARRVLFAPSSLSVASPKESDESTFVRPPI